MYIELFRGYMHIYTACMYICRLDLRSPKLALSCLELLTPLLCANRWRYLLAMVDCPSLP